VPSSNHALLRCQGMELPPTLEHIAAAVHWLEDLAMQEDWPARTAFGLTLSVDEALTNIVSYAFLDGSGGIRTANPTIRLTCQRTQGEIVVKISDNGSPFDPLSIEIAPLAASLDEAVAGGHGLRLMRHYLKSISYALEDNWNTLTLVA
jgi:serine/threonine-protein kinase RsbW